MSWLCHDIRIEFAGAGRIWIMQIIHQYDEVKRSHGIEFAGAGRIWIMQIIHHHDEVKWYWQGFSKRSWNFHPIKKVHLLFL
jgi:hypothetical protein